MTKRVRAPIVWAAVVLALLAGAYLIAARSGPPAEGQAPAGYIH